MKGIWGLIIGRDVLFVLFEISLFEISFSNRRLSGSDHCCWVEIHQRP